MAPVPQRLFLAGLFTFLLPGCDFGPVPLNPDIAQYPDSQTAETACRNKAYGNPNRIVHYTTGRSMEPLIHAGDWIVVEKRAFSKIVPGRIYAVRLGLNRDDPTMTTTHRAVLVDEWGVVMRGDHNFSVDKGVRMTPLNLEGECIFLAQVRKP